MYQVRACRLTVPVPHQAITWSMLTYRQYVRLCSIHRSWSAICETLQHSPVMLIWQKIFKILITKINFKNKAFKVKIISPGSLCVNSPWPMTLYGDTDLSTLSQIMAWCLTAPSPYLMICEIHLRIISQQVPDNKIPGANVGPTWGLANLAIWGAKLLLCKMSLKIRHLKLLPHLPGNVLSFLILSPFREHEVYMYNACWCPGDAITQHQQTQYWLYPVSRMLPSTNFHIISKCVPWNVNKYKHYYYR